VAVVNEDFTMAGPRAVPIHRVFLTDKLYHPRFVSIQLLTSFVLLLLRELGWSTRIQGNWPSYKLRRSERKTPSEIARNSDAFRGFPCVRWSGRKPNNSRPRTSIGSVT